MFLSLLYIVYSLELKFERFLAKVLGDGQREGGALMRAIIDRKLMVVLGRRRRLYSLFVLLLLLGELRLRLDRDSLESMVLDPAEFVINLYS
jgi:hypothetical protein